MWIASARYADGTEIEKRFAYNENGNYLAEGERQYQLESWLVSAHEDCVWYSVSYEPDDD